MTSFLSSHSTYSAMANIHDRLGWRSFLEGRISKILVQEMQNHLQNSSSCYTATFWARKFASRLILLTHHQWRHRNSHLHYRGKENKTFQEHEETMRCARELTRLDSSALLPQFRDLLAEDFDALFEGSTTDRQYWIHEMEAALAATAIHQAARKRKRRQPHTLCPGSRNTTSTQPPHDDTPDSHSPAPNSSPTHNTCVQTKRNRQSSITQFFPPTPLSTRFPTSPSTSPDLTKRGLKHKKRRKK
jgi:hypothetical protein